MNRNITLEEYNTELQRLKQIKRNLQHPIRLVDQQLENLSERLSFDTMCICGHDRQSHYKYKYCCRLEDVVSDTSWVSGCISYGCCSEGGNGKKDKVFEAKMSTNFI
jgi:hypothetical protein